MPSEQELREGERERLVDDLARAMDGPITLLGVAFLLLVLAETALGRHEPLLPWLDVAGWVLWGFFLAEFAVRLVAAPSTRGYLRRNWWQLVFLAVPFLRFLRVARPVARLRPGRLGRVLASAVRGLRAATRTLTSRVAWLSAATAIVALTASQLLFHYGGYTSYTRALHDAALSTITGEPLPSGSGVADILELFLALYAVGVFAFLAGSLGAYLIERSDARSGPVRAVDDDPGL